MQSFLEHLTKPEFLALVSEIFAKDLLKFAYHKNATYVLIKFMSLTEA